MPSAENSMHFSTFCVFHLHDDDDDDDDDNDYKGWTDAAQKARKELGVIGFAAVTKGSALYTAARAYCSA